MLEENLNPLRYVYLETTNFCNLKCTFCNREEVIDKLTHMDIDKYKSMLEKIKDYPIEEAKLMGMGEPFMHPKFYEVCKLFKEYFPNAFLIVATNCQYRFSTKFEEALKYIDLLYFSIDGYEESYEKFRPPAKWPKLIKFLDDFKNANRHNCRATVNYVVNPDNVKDIEKVYNNIVLPYQLEELRLNIAQNWSEDESINANGGYRQEDIEYLQKNWLQNIKGKSNWTFDKCFWPNDGLYVNVYGDVLMCPLNTGAKPFGNLFYDEVEKIRKYEDFKNVRVGCKSNNPTDHCKNCSYYELSPILTKLGVQN